jgi:hypothetical protein
MSLQLRSIDHGPASLPIWELILDDLGNPPAARVAKVLGLGVSTVHRYRQLGAAPRACQLALFWLTRWGQSRVNVNAVNDCQMAVSYVASLRRELEFVRLQLSRAPSSSPLIGGPDVV